MGRLGVTIGPLVPALAAFDAPQLYRAMSLLGDLVVLSLGTLSLGTKWAW